MFAISLICNANAGNVLPASAVFPPVRVSAPPKLPTDSNANAMPALPAVVLSALQEFADKRQRLAVVRVGTPNKYLSADALCPLARRNFKLAHGLHSDLQELEFQELKQWKYLR
ncbi:MAG: hypothetical protein WBM34_16085 [Woeseiaceae bacterium]